MRAVLRDQGGSMYVELAVCIVVLFSVLAMLLTIPPVFVYKQNMDNACRQIATMAAETGSIGSEVTEYADSICDAYGITGQISFTGEIDGESIQLRSKFVAELSSTYNITLGNFMGQDLSVSIPLVSTTHSMGRRYLK